MWHYSISWRPYNYSTLQWLWIILNKFFGHWMKLSSRKQIDYFSMILSVLQTCQFHRQFLYQGWPLSPEPGSSGSWSTGGGGCCWCRGWRRWGGHFEGGYCRGAANSGEPFCRGKVSHIVINQLKYGHCLY